MSNTTECVLPFTNAISQVYGPVAVAFSNMRGDKTNG